MTELWKDAPGFDGYEVSNLGRVRRVSTGKCLKPSIGKGKNAYPRVFPCVNGRDKGALVHVLMMEAFVGPCPAGYEVNHKNGIKTDLAFDNLEYVTSQQNNIHALLTGLRKPRPILTHCPRGHLKDGINRTRVLVDGSVSFYPRCRVCNRDSARRQYHARKAAA